MNYNAICNFGSRVIIRTFNAIDDSAGKVLSSVGQKLTKHTSIPSELAVSLYEAGYDVSKKNARRMAEAMIKEQALSRIDTATKTAVKIVNSLDPTPGALDVAEEVVENMNMAGARNLSLAKAFKNASEADPFSFKSKDLPVYAQNIIRSYYA